MKKTLYWKLLLGYLIFGILGFILVSTVTAEVELHYLEKHTASDLYREATLVANKYAAEYYKNTMTLSDLNNHLADQYRRGHSGQFRRAGGSEQFRAHRQL